MELQLKASLFTLGKQLVELPMGRRQFYRTFQYRLWNQLNRIRSNCIVLLFAIISMRM